MRRVGWRSAGSRGSESCCLLLACLLLNLSLTHPGRSLRLPLPSLFSSRMELYWRTYVSLLLHSVPPVAPQSDKGALPPPAFKPPSRFSLFQLRLARQADQYPSPTPSILLSPLTLVLVGLVWLWDMLTAQGWSEEEQMGRGVLRRDWVPREVWEECVEGKKWR